MFCWRKNWLNKLISISQLSLLITGASLCFGNGALATEIIDLRYKNSQVIIKTKELKKFAETGEVPDKLQTFFDLNTAEVPQLLSNLLTEKIKISRRFVKDVLDSTTGQFFLLKLEETIKFSSNREDLETMKKTLIKAYKDDRRVSLMELLKEYPAKKIKVDITDLEEPYNDVKNFVEDILPALEVAKSVVEDLVCECEQQ